MATTTLLRPTTPALSASDLATALNRGETMTLVDVRPPNLYERCHLPGSINLPDADPIGMVHHLAGKEGVVLICADGQISSRAARGLRFTRIASVRHLEGGVEAWESRGGPLAERMPSGREQLLPPRQESETRRRVREIANSFSLPVVASALVASAALLVVVMLWI
jgi:rhodanese-related sulfurtransferase